MPEGTVQQSFEARYELPRIEIVEDSHGNPG